MSISHLSVHFLPHTLPGSHPLALHAYTIYESDFLIVWNWRRRQTNRRGKKTAKTFFHRKVIRNSIYLCKRFNLTKTIWHIRLFTLFQRTLSALYCTVYVVSTYMQLILDLATVHTWRRWMNVANLERTNWKLNENEMFFLAMFFFFFLAPNVNGFKHVNKKTKHPDYFFSIEFWFDFLWAKTIKRFTLDYFLTEKVNEVTCYNF